MQYFILIFILILSTGCSVKYEKNASFEDQQKSKIYDLTQALISLNPSVLKKEAQHAASIAVLYPLDLTQKYELTSPPLWHNSLINMQIKQRGLCYHFAEDLAYKLKLQRFKSLKIRWADHKNGQYWEHNALVITAWNQPFKQGILFDAWRDSGKLFWDFVKNDTQYDWVENLPKGRYFGSITY